MRSKIEKLMMIGIALSLGTIQQAVAQIPVCPPFCSTPIVHVKPKAKSPQAPKAIRKNAKKAKVSAN